MPVTYRIDSAHRLIRTKCSAPLSFAQVLAHFRELLEDPECVGLLDVLLDVTEADRPPMSRQLTALNSEMKIIRGKARFGRCAVVADRDVMFGMMRVFEVVTGEHFQEVRVFRQTADAERWLASAPPMPKPDGAE